MFKLKSTQHHRQRKTSRQIHGASGEEKAVQFLIASGYRILERNFHKRYGEIDIVALKDDTLIFVEVKTRYSDKFGPPEEAITSWKLRALVQSAYYYKLTHAELPESLRIDVIAIEMEGEDKVERIEHIKNITL